MEASALQAPARLAGISLSGPLLRLRSDEQLVALFRAGSDEAFRVIHDRYRQRLLAYMRQMLSGSRQDAEDACQDVFMRAHAALRASDKPISLRAWLYRVAHNRCIDQLRKPPVVPFESIEPASSTSASAPDPLEEAQQKEELRRLITDVRRLPAQQRSVLLMRELEGASYTDLADAHGTSVAAVKSLLVRARMGLVQAAEARDIDCLEIRSDLASAHGRGVRATGRARRHLKDCAGCREYRTGLRSVERRLAGLAPGGPLAGLAKVLGLGGGGAAASGGAAAGGGGAVVGGGAAAATVCKVAAVVCSTVVAAGGAVEVRDALVERGGSGAATISAAGAAVANPNSAAAPPVASSAEVAASADQRPAPDARPERVEAARPERAAAETSEPAVAPVVAQPVPEESSPGTVTERPEVVAGEDVDPAAPATDDPETLPLESGEDVDPGAGEGVPLPPETDGGEDQSGFVPVPNAEGGQGSGGGEAGAGR